MSSNHYETLEIHPQASQLEVKQAYRRLVKQFHPDRNPEGKSSHDRIARINAAYEVLGDPYHRQLYDHQQQRQTQSPAATHWRTATAQAQHQQRPTGQDADAQLQAWLKWVFQPVSQWVALILEPLSDQLDQLAADPFDDELLTEFQDYLADCHHLLTQAQRCFRSMPNPATLAGPAANLFYCLNQIGDGLEELQTFTLNYDDRYLHTGQELFRIAEGLHWEAETAINHL